MKATNMAGKPTPERLRYIGIAP